jgi:hypothetical protein
MRLMRNAGFEKRDCRYGSGSVTLERTVSDWIDWHSTILIEHDLFGKPVPTFSDQL